MDKKQGHKEPECPREVVTAAWLWAGRAGGRNQVAVASLVNHKDGKVGHWLCTCSK